MGKNMHTKGPKKRKENKVHQQQRGNFDCWVADHHRPYVRGRRKEKFFFFFLFSFVAQESYSLWWRHTTSELVIVSIKNPRNTLGLGERTPATTKATQLLLLQSSFPFFAFRLLYIILYLVVVYKDKTSLYSRSAANRSAYPLREPHDLRDGCVGDSATLGNHWWRRPRPRCCWLATIVRPRQSDFHSKLFDRKRILMAKIKWGNKSDSTLE